MVDLEQRVNLDLQLKHILPYISTYEKIRLKVWSGEEFYPSYREVRSYEECYVVNISVFNSNSIMVELRDTI